MGGATLFEKVWAEHEVANLGDGLSLLHVDRHLMHDLNGMKSLVELRERVAQLGIDAPRATPRPVPSPDLTPMRLEEK